MAVSSCILIYLNCNVCKSYEAYKSLRACNVIILKHNKLLLFYTCSTNINNATNFNNFEIN